MDSLLQKNPREIVAKLDEADCLAPDTRVSTVLSNPRPQKKFAEKAEAVNLIPICMIMMARRTI